VSEKQWISFTVAESDMFKYTVRIYTNFSLCKFIKEKTQKEVSKN